MTTSAVNLVQRGMPSGLATEVAAQIDATAAETVGYPNVVTLMAFGMAAALAIELGAQMTAGAGNTAKLMALGMPGLLAERVVADIATANA
jgi:hypothetical protein